MFLKSKTILYPVVYSTIIWFCIIIIKLLLLILHNNSPRICVYWAWFQVPGQIKMFSLHLNWACTQGTADLKICSREHWYSRISVRAHTWGGSPVSQVGFLVCSIRLLHLLFKWSRMICLQIFSCCPSLPPIPLGLKSNVLFLEKLSWLFLLFQFTKKKKIT